MEPPEEGKYKTLITGGMTDRAVRWGAPGTLGSLTPCPPSSGASCSVPGLSLSVEQGRGNVDVEKTPENNSTEFLGQPAPGRLCVESALFLERLPEPTLAWSFLLRPAHRYPVRGRVCVRLLFLSLAALPRSQSSALLKASSLQARGWAETTTYGPCPEGTPLGACGWTGWKSQLGVEASRAVVFLRKVLGSGRLLRGQDGAWVS